MTSLRCTQRLLKKLKVQPEKALPAATNRLGDWYANVLNVGPKRFVIATSERTLLTVVVPARDAPRLRERIREAVHDMLFRIRVPLPLAAEEVRGMERMPIGKTADRSVLGSMNEFAFLAKHFVAGEPGGPVDLLRLQMFLANTPMGAIEYAFPIEEACRAFGTTPPRSQGLARSPWA